MESAHTPFCTLGVGVAHWTDCWIMTRETCHISTINEVCSCPPSTSSSNTDLGNNFVVCFLHCGMVFIFPSFFHLLDCLLPSLLSIQSTLCTLYTLGTTIFDLSWIYPSVKSSAYILLHMASKCYKQDRCSLPDDFCKQVTLHVVYKGKLHSSRCPRGTGDSTFA